MKLEDELRRIADEMDNATDEPDRVCACRQANSGLLRHAAAEIARLTTELRDEEESHARTREGIGKYS